MRVQKSQVSKQRISYPEGGKKAATSASGNDSKACLQDSNVPKSTLVVERELNQSEVFQTIGGSPNLAEVVNNSCDVDEDAQHKALSVIGKSSTSKEMVVVN